MDNDSTLNVQNTFFNQVRKDRSPVTITLTGGRKVSGLVKAFDRFTLLLDTSHGDQIVFKHAIACVSLFEPEGGQARPAESEPGSGAGRFGNGTDLKGGRE